MRLILNVNNLKEEMVEKGWDEKQLADVIGVSNTQVNRVLNGVREPGNTFIAGLYETFGFEKFKTLFLLSGSCQKARDKEACKT